MIAEELNMDRETVRQILTTNLIMKMLCQNGPKESTSFQLQKNTNARTCSVFTISFQRDFSFPKIEKFAQRNPFSLN